jgi:hypothetical protein
VFRVFDQVRGDLEATASVSVELLEPPACRVRNVQQDTWFATPDGSALEDAISAASPGERLNVFGTCVGNFAIDRDLTVSGSHVASNPTTLSGGGTGRVLFIAPDVTVTLSHLTITGGNVSTPGGGGGLLVNDGATVLLYRSTVSGNATRSGDRQRRALTVVWSSIEQNHAVDNGDDGGSTTWPARPSGLVCEQLGRQGRWRSVQRTARHAQRERPCLRRRRHPERRAVDAHRTVVRANWPTNARVPSARPRRVEPRRGAGCGRSHRHATASHGRRHLLAT